ncbi:unnamed protein product [Rhizophagus irregularis]|uniref:Uncharacterized protein n=2 Tax=Rhizophagus irregularis TaxID=588596 RepID=A0A2N1N477_9GLOM|nr:hypothetical protein RhiirC2_781917 [Rhizophagus irregularis]CAB5343231.1 unnamed protein product [Rhizophagus irregularis]CAB5362890.1 unnamed protein product [Rhizophagus irregularis]CAB5392105.1 unnamed protein product [Rhizophagus irregularis]CAB5393714.1 unnamed protein product [Rhizophagus irregularis]
MEQTHKNVKKDRASRTKWSENAIKALFSFLLEHKNKLEELKYTRGATSNPGNIQLWKDAEAFLLTFNFENSYSNIQIANKWKNLVDNYKSQLAESKKSGGPPITIQYKEEIEAILDKDRPTLNPKSCIDSSEFSSRNEKELNFQENLSEKKQTETPCVIPKIGRKHKNKRENDDADANFDDQSKKKSKKHGNNLGNILQHWIEQQEVRQIELDKRREEKEKKEQDQRLELLHMKQQSDMMLFGILNNLSNSLNSLHTNQNQVNQVNQDDLDDLEFPQFD